VTTRGSESLTSIIPHAVLNAYDEYSLQDLVFICDFESTNQYCTDGYGLVKDAAECAPHGCNGMSGCSALKIQVLYKV
jgi:hypothetical protein